LFFSTTDARGVIEQANSVFVRLSRYRREQLIGAPHNIIRHASMPAGAFLLMWDALQSGQPFCAYVDNLAADGSTYRVFATITPLGDGYLSVRARPFVDGLCDAAFSLYEVARPLELELRDQGWSAHEAAVRGAEKLGELLAGADFPSYEEFTWAALPAEVEARIAHGAGVARRPLATGGLAEMLAVARRIDDELREWVASLEDLQRVADALRAAAPQLIGAVAEDADVAERINNSDIDNLFSTAVVYLRVWAQMAPEAAAVMTELLAELDQLRRSCAQTRFRIALAILHNQAVGQFVAEIVDRVPGSEAAHPAILDLGRAVDEGLAEMAASTTRNAELAAASASRISMLRDLLDLPQTMIREWLSRADRSSPVFTETADAIAARVEATQANIDVLGTLADECRLIAVPLDVGVVEDLSVRLRELLASGAAAEAPLDPSSGAARE
jgi:aerotaxis receptor